MRKKSRNIILTLIMTFLLFGLSLPMTAKADTPTNWLDNSSYYSTTWYGDGTASRYDISSAADLAGLAYLVQHGNDFSQKTITLKDDINISAYDWTPIGTATRPFCGTFDGGDNTVSGLSINTTSIPNTGLFGVAIDAVIKNVAVSGSITLTIARMPNVGGLVGYTSNTNIDKCSSSIIIAAATTTNSDTYVGGLVGYLDVGSIIKNSFATGNVTSSSAATTVGFVTDSAKANNCGGLIGGAIGSASSETLISSCYATGNVTAVNSSNANVNIGGLAGYAQYLTISSCHTSGLVACASTSYYRCAGGIVGYMYNGSYLYDSYSTSNVTQSGATSHTHDGGLIGANTGTVQSSYSTGDITLSGNIDTVICEGGSIGYSVGDISNCYSTGKVTSTAECIEYIYVGGMVGQQAGTVSNCYAAGVVDASEEGDTLINAGGFVGDHHVGSITNCYWLSGTNGTDYSTGGYGQNLAAINSLTMLTSDQLSNTGTIDSSTTLGTGNYASKTILEALNTVAKDAMYTKGWKVDSKVNHGYPIFTGGIATINTKINGTAAAVAGAVELWQSGSKVATAVSTDTGVYQVLVPDGTYNIYINGFDSEKTVAINNKANSETVDIYTITFGATDTKDATGSTISATVDGQTIHNGDAVPAGKTVVLTALGAGCSTYTYAWSGTGTNGETTATINITITALSGAINVTCTVTGSAWVAGTLPYYLNDKGEKVFLGFAAVLNDEMQYIETTGKTIYFAQNTKTFSDISESWAKSSIKFVTERELFFGVTANQFAPNEQMTRAMFITVLGRLYERSYGSITQNTGAFTDVKYDGWNGKYVSWAAKNGLVFGTGNGLFEPNRAITREEMAVIVYRFAKYLGATPTGDWSVKLIYTDSADISNWATEAATYCQISGIIKGKDGSMFAPNDIATRGEASVILERLINNIVSYSVK